MAFGPHVLGECVAEVLGGTQSSLHKFGTCTAVRPHGDMLYDHGAVCCRKTVQCTGHTCIDNLLHPYALPVTYSRIYCK